MSSKVVQATALLIVFIHGFKGSADTTFEDFPNRLAHMLGATHPELTIESVVYPTYDTKGRLDAAVDNFIEWLTERTLEYESKPMLHPTTEEPLPASQTGRGGGAGSLKIIIAGHSMGGLVGVDAALAIARSATPSTASEKSSTEITPIWPRVCGVIAYDTPYFGVHPNTFKHGIGKVSEYVQAASALGALFAPMGGALAAGWGARQEANATGTGTGGGSGGNRSSPTSPGGADGWASWAFGGSSTSSSTLGSNRAGGGEASTSSSRSLRPNSTAEEEKTNASAAARSNWSSALYAAGGAAILAGGAAAFMKQQQIREGVGSSYNYVQDHLAFVGNLWDPEAQRQRLDSLVAMPSILFHCFYTEMPASRALGREQARTFIILPPRGASSSRSFTPMMNSRATDEVDAHVTMFSSTKNPSYFHLGTKSASIISEVLADEAAFGQSSRAQAATDEEPEVAEGLRQGDRGATAEPAESVSGS